MTLAIAIIGALTGVAGLYLHWRQTRFDLRVEDADLRYEPEAVEQLAARSPGQLNGTAFDLQVELHLHNRGVGSGSIQKPRLEVHAPDGTRHEIRPQIEEVQSEVLERTPGYTRSRVWTERHGGSYALTGRARCDDLLDYTVEFEQGTDAHVMLNAFDSLEFALLYRDHRGREQREPIRSKSGWEELI